MKPIVVTRLLASCWQEGEEVRWYEREQCTCTTKYFMPASKMFTVKEVINVLPNE